MTRPQWLPERGDLAGIALALVLGALAVFLTRVLPPSPLLSDVLLALAFGAVITNVGPLRRLVGVSPPGDKQMRLAAQTPAMEAGRVHLPLEAPWLEDYLHELTTFPNAKHDDQVDSTSQALAWIRNSACNDPWLRYAREEMGKRAGVAI